MEALPRLSARFDHLSTCLKRWLVAYRLGLLRPKAYSHQGSPPHHYYLTKKGALA
jgi:hypothetical protein